MRERRFPHSDATYVALSPDGQWLATSGWQSTRVQLRNTQTGECLLDLIDDRARVNFTPDGRELVVSMSQAFVFYDVKTQKVSRRIQREGSMHLGFIAFSRDARMMAMEVSPGVIRLCEVTTGRAIANLQEPNGNLAGWMGFSPDGTQLIVTANAERAIHRWDLRELRVELKAMGLDWDWPEFPPQSEEMRNLPPLDVEVVPSEVR